MHFSIFWKKKKFKTRLKLYCFGPKTAETARPISFRARRPHLGCNLGLGRQSPARPLARLGRDLAHSISAIHSHPTADRASRSYKSRRRAPVSETLAHSFGGFLSLLRRSLLSLPCSLFSAEQNRARRERVVERGGHPWHRRRPPRRRARSPAGERAAVERPGRGDPFAEPGEQQHRFGGLSSPASAKGFRDARRGSFFSRSSPSPSLFIPTHRNWG